MSDNLVTPVPAPTSPRLRSHGLGWRKNALITVPDTRVISARGHFGAGLVPPEALRMKDLVQIATDQGPSEGCVGQALGNAWVVRMRALGYFPKEPSRLALYTGAREMAKQLLGEAIADGGSFPRLGWQSMQDNGVPSNDVWVSQGFPGYDGSTINTELPLDVWQDASAGRVQLYAMIDGDPGTSRIHQIQQALAQDFPVTFGVHVGQAFMDFTGTALAPLLDPTDDEGGHYLTILGYTTSSAGAISFLGLNSWSNTWGDKGFFWCGPEFLNQPSVQDVGIMEVSLETGGKKDGEKPAKEAA